MFEPNTEARNIIMFQSLFYWMLLSNTRNTQTNTCIGMCSFNPCFIGCYSLTRIISVSVDANSGFNPCFIGCYSLTESRHSRAKQTSTRCFNPCFIGCYSLTAPKNARLTLSVRRFQSLFYWMLLSNLYCYRLHYSSYQVSILVLLDVTL